MQTSSRLSDTRGGQYSMRPQHSQVKLIAESGSEPHYQHYSGGSHRPERRVQGKTLTLRRHYRPRQADAAKRLIDVAGALLLLTMFAPVFVLCYLLIRLDSDGPAIYDGKRVGRGGKTFRCLKFRTMHTDADGRLRELLNAHTELRLEYATYRKLRRDPRVTRLGKFLRRSSLDELPQLLNVLKGDMSLVGPRPYLPSERRAMGNNEAVILLVKPGLTGYWQVSGRSNVSFQERLDMEERYVRQWSLRWDIKLLFKTVLVVCRARGAS